MFESQNPEKINIKNLSTEGLEEKTGPSFDPEKEITEEDWRHIKERIENFPVEKYLDTLNLLAEVALLLPNRKTELNLSDDLFFKVQNETKQARAPSSFQWGRVLSEAFAVRILYPDKELELNSELYHFAINRNLSDLSSEDLAVHGIVRLALESKVVFPEKDCDVIQRVLISNHDWEVIKTALEKLAKKEFYRDYFYFAANAKLLWPERFSEIVVTQNMWDGMKDYLNKVRAGKKGVLNGAGLIGGAISDSNWITFVKCALSMKILAAERAYLTDKGQIVIDMGERKLDINQKIPPMPEIRKF